jgi:hypothetical protein
MLPGDLDAVVADLEHRKQCRVRALDTLEAATPADPTIAIRKQISQFDALLAILRGEWTEACDSNFVDSAAQAEWIKVTLKCLHGWLSLENAKLKCAGSPRDISDNSSAPTLCNEVHDQAGLETACARLKIAIERLQALS